MSSGLAMRSLYVRIYLTVLAALALFAGVSGWLVQNHLERERARFEARAGERGAAWGELLQRVLPPPGSPDEVQAAALRDWSARLAIPMALDDADGRRIAASSSYLQREAGEPGRPLLRSLSVPLDDGRVLRTLRPVRLGGPPGSAGAGLGPPPMPMPPFSPYGPLGRSVEGVGLVLLLGLLFAAVALGAYPAVRRLTRRLEALKQGVEAFGAGDLQRRVAEDGGDEVAAVGASFNRAAARLAALLQSHRSLLANASHELRSPLARLKMAVSMIEDAPPEQRAALRREIETNVAELDALVEEVLLASRLDAHAAEAPERRDTIELLALAAEEAARVGAGVDGEDLVVAGDERLLRRALRNLLENARRYGGGEIACTVRRSPGGGVALEVADRGPGVPEAFRERIFEPFFRMPGHAEREGGVGLGLALVRQIAERHGGRVRCEPRGGGGSRFTLTLPDGGPAARR